MKKTSVLIFTLIMALLVLASCAGQPANDGGNTANTLDGSQFKTLQDVFDFIGDSEDYENSYTDEYFVSAFQSDNVYYRVIAQMTPDILQALYDLEFDDDWSENIKKTAATLEITTFENLNDKMPSQTELDKYVGKTGQDLFDEGWDYWYYNLEDMIAGMSFELFDYSVAFEYDGEQMENTDDFDFYEAFKDLKIKSVVCDGIGNATWMPEEE
jgi:hypothetical protein